MYSSIVLTNKKSAPALLLESGLLVMVERVMLAGEGCAREGVMVERGYSRELLYVGW